MYRHMHNLISSHRYKYRSLVLFRILSFEDKTTVNMNKIGNWFHLHQCWPTLPNPTTKMPTAPYPCTSFPGRTVPTTQTRCGGTAPGEAIVKKTFQADKKEKAMSSYVMSCLAYKTYLLYIMVTKNNTNLV